jgi:transcriptional regulator with XRE-family HTH domain
MPGAREFFSAQLRAARLTAGFQHQNELADAIGVEHETYRRWERGETEPGIANLRKLALKLQRSLDDLVGVHPGRDSGEAA